MIAVAVGVMAFGFVALGYELKLGIYSLALLAIPLVVAMVYLSQYSRRPYEPWAGSSSSDPDVAVDEPFDDPVEEADLISGQPVPTDGDPASPEPAPSDPADAADVPRPSD